MSTRPALSKSDPTLLFRVGDQDVGLLADSLFEHRKVTPLGIFAALLDDDGVLLPHEQQWFTHPTGDAREPLLKFPCSLERFVEFCVEEGSSEISNESLVRWMMTRVEMNRAREGWEWLNTIAKELFVLDAPEVSRLLPDLDESAAQPPVPCSLSELLQWCDGDDVGKTRIGQPSNRSIERLIQKRVDLRSSQIVRVSIGSSNELTARERHSRINIIVALSVDLDIQVSSPWLEKSDSATRAMLNTKIAQLAERAKIPVQKGKGGAGNIESAVRRAHQKGKISTCSPTEKTIRAVLAEIEATKSTITE